MLTLLLQLSLLTVIFFICIRYDLGKSFKKSLSRAILIGLMIGILYIILQQSSIEGMNTFGSKTKEGIDTMLYCTIANKHRQNCLWIKNGKMIITFFQHVNKLFLPKLLTSRTVSFCSWFICGITVTNMML